MGSGSSASRRGAGGEPTGDEAADAADATDAGVVTVLPKQAAGASTSDASEPEPESPGRENRQEATGDVPQVLAWSEGNNADAGQVQSNGHTAGPATKGSEGKPSGSGGGGRAPHAASSNETKAPTSSSGHGAHDHGTPGAAHLQGFGASGDPRGKLRPGQAVRITGLENAKYLNGKQGVLRCFDNDLSRWVVKMGNGEEKGIRSQNLVAVQGSRNNGTGGGGSGAADSANKELEALLLQTNWSAIYQLFYQRFGIAVLDKIERGYAVKAAVEMSLSIVAKCFALLRSDPGGRLHCTPLHIAALQSSTEAAEVIVRDLPKLVEQTHKPSHSALCPLHIAILCGAQAIVELLLEGSADPNVRTLHDVCPMHLAATTSKELCQVLLSYKAEPLRRDVMGSTAVHYAVAFKQQAVVEFLLSHSPAAHRLACEADQKRVTPLHISCALYTSDEDFPTPMMLLANGAKPWQADVSGASARDVVAWNIAGPLVQFFESNGDRAQSAAQQWIDEHRGIVEEATQSDGEDSLDSQDDEKSQKAAETPRIIVHGDGDRSGQRQSLLERKGAGIDMAATLSGFGAAVEKVNKEFQRKNSALDGGAPVSAEMQQEVEALTNQVERLAQLYEQEQASRAEEVKALNAQAQQAAEEISTLKARKGEADSELERLRGHLADQQEGSSKEAKSLHDEVRQLQEENGQLRARRAEAEERCQQLARERQDAESRASDAAVDFETKLQEVRNQHVQALATQRNESEAARLRAEEAQAQEAQEDEVIRLRCAETESELERLRAEMQLERSGKDAEVKELQDQVRQLREETAQLRSQRAEAEDRCQQLALERQEVESRTASTVAALEGRLQDVAAQHEQALARVREDAAAAISRADAAQERADAMQPTIDKHLERIQTLEAQFAEEQILRKKYHNQIQDMKGAIRVFCRFRPLVRRERDMGDTIAARKVDEFSVEVHRPDSHGHAPGHHAEDKRFQFDSVFGQDCSQDEVFADCKDLIQSAVDGYNVTIFAYGQTGAGKTFTMYGSEAEPGLAPRSIGALFSVIQREQARGKTFKVRCYMIEVYKQEIIDLLCDKPAKQGDRGLEVKRDLGRGMMYVEGVTERDVQTPDQLRATLHEGEKKRHVKQTAMNTGGSSRSHLLLSIVIECQVKEPEEQVIYGKITLCDLAGSERPKKSEVTGDALKEAIEINKSLSALGDVIEALTKGNKSVPYRNHKLTMLMQDSLGGTAKTLMFVNCSPAGSNADETMMSLKWASRTRQITNDVKRNADSKEVARLKQVIAMMSLAQASDAPGPDAAVGPATEQEESGVGMVS